MRTSAEVGPASATIANLGYHSGLGIDLKFGTLVIGFEGRHFVMTGKVLETTVDLDGNTVALKAGVGSEAGRTLLPKGARRTAGSRSETRMVGRGGEVCHHDDTAYDTDPTLRRAHQG